MTKSMPATQDVTSQGKEALRVLSVEDNPGDAILVREMLRDASPDGFRLAERRPALDRGGLACSKGSVDCVLLDLSLPDAEGLEALAQVRTVALDVPIIVLTGRTDEVLAVQAVHEGAQDYLIKGQVDARLLARSINYAIERKRAEVELAHQAMHDALTGLPNRALFYDRLGQALEPRSAARAPRSPCCSSTSTASSWSTTRSAMAPATSCSSRSPSGWRTCCAPGTPRRASAATSS